MFPAPIGLKKSGAVDEEDASGRLLGLYTGLEAFVLGPPSTFDGCCTEVILDDEELEAFGGHDEVLAGGARDDDKEDAAAGCCGGW